MKASELFMCTVVEDYIFHRKGVKVNITPKPTEIPQLVKAYNYAIKWFKTNSIK